jgi:hypothetical protein
MHVLINYVLKVNLFRIFKVWIVNILLIFFHLRSHAGPSIQNVHYMAISDIKSRKKFLQKIRWFGSEGCEVAPAGNGGDLR